MNRERILALLGATILKSLFMTLRIRVVDESGFQKDPSTDPVLFCFWHNRILGITYAFKRIYDKNIKNKTTTDRKWLYWLFLISWSLYGVAAFLPYVPKNIMYNILDLFSKNLLGVILFYTISKNRIP